MSALQPQRVSIPITGGQEQSAAPELIEPPLLTVAQNVVYERTGELRKRRGWLRDQEALNGLTYLPYCERLATRGDELVWIGEQRSQQGDPREGLGISSRLPAESTEVTPPKIWNRKGNIARWNVSTLTEIPSLIPGTRIEAVDCAFAGDSLSTIGTDGVVGVLWQNHNEEALFFAAVDVATGSTISVFQLDLSVATNEPIRILALKGSDSLWYFHIFYCVTELGENCDVEHRSIPAYAPFALNLSAADVVATDVQAWDACATGPVGLGLGAWAFIPRLFFAWSTWDTANVTVNAYSGGALGALSAIDSDTYTMVRYANQRVHIGQLSCCCDPDSRYVWVHVATSNPTPTYNNEGLQWSCSAGGVGVGSLTFGSATEVALADASRGNTLGVQCGWAGTSVVAGVTRYDNPIWGWSKYGTTRQDIRESFPTGGTSFSCAYSPWGRHWNYRGRDYWTVIRGHAADAICIEFIGAGPARDDGAEYHESTGRALGGLLAHPTPPSYLSRYLNTGGRNSTVESWYTRGRFFSAWPIMSLDSVEMKIALLDVSAVEREMYDWTDTPAGLYFSGSIPWCYDGGQGHEVGFAHRPQSITNPTGEIYATVYADLVTPLAPGTYWVAMCWEAVDQLGRVSRSAPSIHSTIVGAANSLRVVYQTLGVNSKLRMNPVVYVSNDGGLNYYRSTQVITDNPFTAAESTTVDLVTANLFVAGAPTLYTSQGILDNSPPPQARLICYWGNRIWYANKRSVWYTRDIIDAEEPSLNEALSFQMPCDVTAFAPLDDRLVLFGRNSIYIVTGDGPTDTGEGGSFSTPQRQRSDFGCIDCRSVVRVEKGILFQSTRGIELFDGASTQYVSGGIERAMRESGYSEIVSSSLDPIAQICRFVAKSGSFYLMFCYHTAFELWTTATVPRTNATGGRTEKPIDLTNAFGCNWLALNDIEASGVVGSPSNAIVREIARDESPTYGPCVDGYPTDGYAGMFWFQSTVEFANAKFDGLQGFQRIWRYYLNLRDYDVDTGIELSSVPDYNGTRVTRTWTTAAEITSGLAYPGTHRRYTVHVANQQCSAIRVRFRDLQRTDAPGGTPSKDTRFVLTSLGFEFGIKPGTGRGAPGSKK